ncbi:DNA-binding LacI/PurR family transcriptional regulator [Crossiella equi]|uniref:DNA-binding LacI/PurR family transcriptional regulator n=1 Tax=Crossiella equi TaxID=130796 RepID=A0ABS5AQD2_9PSEU|nr:LacI family DNA-binding transcriptional regulator [Crossiella equi]MBP2478774.1 DNA-binding LacI/PurR family transcriptional regulator [Crossiella equi]
MASNKLARVAEFAGVSVSTVKRVLAGTSEVSPRTRDAVLTALTACGYDRPDRVHDQRLPLVGLVVPDLLNPIFPAFAEAVVGLLNLHELIPVLCARTADGVVETQHIDTLLRQNPSGLVFIGASLADAGEEQGRLLRERGVPLVLINADDEYSGGARLAVDDAGAAESALAYLAALGHERVGLLLGPIAHVPSARKLAGFAAFQQRRGVPPEEWRALVSHALFSMEGGATALPRLLAQRVSAVVCASDALALGVVRAARRAGLRVPEDLSVIGFDDSPFMVATDPPLTTIRQPVAAIAAAAVSALVGQIEGHAPSAELMLFDTELIVRASTAPRLR